MQTGIVAYLSNLAVRCSKIANAVRKGPKLTIPFRPAGALSLAPHAHEFSVRGRRPFLAMRARLFSHQGQPPGIDPKSFFGSFAAGSRLTVPFRCGTGRGVVDDDGDFFAGEAALFHAGDRVMPQSREADRPDS